MSEPKQKRATSKHLLIIAGAGILLSLPVIIFGVPFLSDDASFHAAWYSNFSKQLWSGDLYPRWLMGMNGGLGSPVFFFYPPVPYFFTSLFRPFFPNDQYGLHQLGLAASAALIASGITGYLWLRNLASSHASLLAAILYMATPYHLASDLYVRAAFAEYWAFVWMPLILYFVHRLAAGQQSALIGIAVSWAFLAMTHLPTSVTFAVVPFAYVVLLTPKGRKLKMLAYAVLAAIVGSGLAAIYLVPALTTESFVLLPRNSTGYFSYANWLFFAKFSLWEEEKITLLMLTADLIVIATCAFIINRSTSCLHKGRLNRFWYLIALLSVVMMTELSKPIWLLLPTLQKIQFPWRFNGLLTLATTGLLAMAVSCWSGNRASAGAVVRILALISIIAWMPVTLWKISQVYPETNPNQRDIRIRREEFELNQDAPEYRPRWCLSMSSINWESSIDEELWSNLMNKERELLRSEGGLPGHSAEPMIIDGTGRARIQARRTREIDLRVETPEGATVTVPQFYYPYWSAYLAGETRALEVNPSRPNGFINLTVPAGAHDVVLRLERGRPEIVGKLVSLGSLVTLCGFLGFTCFRKTILKTDSRSL